MTLEEAKQHGMDAGRAINQHDQARYNFQKSWFKKALALEEHPVELQEMWNAGYEEERQNDIRFRNLSTRW